MSPLWNAISKLEGIKHNLLSIINGVKKTEFETKLSILENIVASLYQPPISTIKEDFELRIDDLREKVQSYTSFDTPVIPDNMIESFIEKIWVSKDEFRWYFRTDKQDNDEDIEHIKIASFTLTLDDAKEYIYSFSSRRRILSWFDLNVSVWI